MRVKVSLKCQIIKATYLRIYKTWASIETTSLRVILNIRLRKIGNRAVIPVNGAHLDQITPNPPHKIEIMAGKNRWNKAMSMITTNIIRMHILITGLVSTKNFNNSEPQRRSLIMIQKHSMIMNATQTGSIHKTTFSICRKLSSSIRLKRIFIHRKMKIRHAYQTVQQIIFATTLWWFLVHQKLAKREITEENNK